MDNFNFEKFIRDFKAGKNPYGETPQSLTESTTPEPTEETPKETYVNEFLSEVEAKLKEVRDDSKINLSSINSKIKNNSKIDAIAAKVQNDPKAMDALNKLASMYGLNTMNELDSSDFRSIEMAAKKFASNLQEMSDDDDASLTAAGIFGGPFLLAIPGLMEFVQQLAMNLQGSEEYVVGTDSLIYLGSVIAGMAIGNILDRIKNKMEESVTEAEEEDVDVEVDVKDTDLSADDEEVKSANDSIVVDKKIVSLSSLPSETRKILDTLETLRAQAEEFGDQKFITQVGNTITFFTRDFVVAGDAPNPAGIEESLEILKMKKLAGLLTEGEYAKALLNNINENTIPSVVDILKDPKLGLKHFAKLDAYDTKFKLKDDSEAIKKNPQLKGKEVEIGNYYDPRENLLSIRSGNVSANVFPEEVEIIASTYTDNKEDYFKKNPKG